MISGKKKVIWYIFPFSAWTVGHC